MPIITPADLATNLYAEAINEITRGDDSIVASAIATAIQEAKMYLSRYDTTALFGTDTLAPTVHDALLSSLVKDIAVWRLVRLSNSGTNFNSERAAYDDAIGTLKNIMSGQAEPDEWPYAQATDVAPAEGDSISWQSNPKRNNYY